MNGVQSKFLGRKLFFMVLESGNAVLRITEILL